MASKADKFDTEKIEKHMRKLRLGALAREWQKIPFTTKEQYVTDLLEFELKERETNKINQIVKTAGFRVIKTVDDFIWNNNIAIPEGISREEIENFSFVEKKENLILMGAVGTGKTHLATGVTLRACQSGKQARFFTAASLANLLLEKNQKGSLNNFLGTFKKVELMVIDEIGFVPLHKDAAQLLFQVISDCYERKSHSPTSLDLITSNLEFSQWNTIFGDSRLTAALIDRLIHHSHILIFSGESFRLKQSMKRQNLKTSL